MSKELQLAGCIILNATNDILLLHRNTAKRTQWEIPGGKIETNETAAEAAVRELDEELGVKVTVSQTLGTRAFTEDDFTMHYTWLLAVITEGTAQIMEPATHDRVAYYSVQALQTMTGLSPNLQNFLTEVQSGAITLGEQAAQDVDGLTTTEPLAVA